LDKFFDRVNHDKQMAQIVKRVEDKRLLKLFRTFLNAGVMENGLVSPSVEGTPQAGLLSPLFTVKLAILAVFAGLARGLMPTESTLQTAVIPEHHSRRPET